MMRRRLRHGLTLTEAMVAMAIAVILLGVAVPSFSSSIARARLEGVVNELSIDLQHARSVSIRRRATVMLATAADGRSYTLTRGTETLKTVSLPSGVALTSNVSVEFDPLRGTAQAAVFDATSVTLAASLRVNTTAMGRIQVCSPNRAFGGYYAAC
jgi:type IV fimbrial biogenesis protein FimT